MDRLAYVTRYTSIGLETALRCEGTWLYDFAKAVERILKRESGKDPG